ncbi:PD-(D/E)XK nuclease family protein [Halorussus salinisoli]|uniref:PD-(D/E)XK nuclease family protein n=1 Tax=Halorussus salinisoli TaxID=2558242 RepID=UPI0014856990|nr:PD-(D/E)XK nuclease family protein [Halorussus salinisoli]
MTSESIEHDLNELTQRLDTLPEADEPPPTTLQILGRSRRETDWQQFLLHFLTPDEAHGLNDEALEHLLRALSARDDFEFSFSRFDLDDVQVEQEVVTDQGRPDIVIWSDKDWFLCFELKVDSSEGTDQTKRYVEVEAFDGINLDKSVIEGHHYVYLAPADASSPNACEFVHVSWEWIASELQAFLAESYGEYPSRTTAQLNAFIDTIRNELTMTDYQENQQEKMELYVRHYDEIQEVEDAFVEGWTEFEQEWGTRLANALDTGEVESSSPVPDEYVTFKFNRNGESSERWIFKQATSDWAWIFRDGWWKRADTRENIYNRNRPDVRIGFLHRLEKHRENAVRDHELKIFFRMTPPSPEEFKSSFEQMFYDRKEKIADYTPQPGEITGNKSNLLEVTYDIDVKNHESYFEAYIAALRDAFVDHVVDNEELVSKIDDIYTESLEEIDLE